MSKQPAAATRTERRPIDAPAERDPEETFDDEYRAAEWSYDPTAYDPNVIPEAYLQPDAPDLEKGDEPFSGNGGHETDEAPGETWPAKMRASKMAPRPNLRMAGRRPAGEPKDTEGKILEVSARLQELLEKRKEETEIGFPATAALTKRTGFKPAGSSQGGSRLPAAPPISLPVRAHRVVKGSGWPGLGRSRIAWKRPTFFTLLALAIVGGSFWLGRASNPAVVQPVKMAPIIVPGSDAPLWSDAQLKALDQALTSDRAGDLNAAYRTITDLSVKAKTVLGLKSYIANLESRRGNAPEAESLLAATGDLATPNGQEQMGFLFTRSRDFDKAIDWLSKAAAASPFEARYFYHWAEALRRKGNFAEAVTRFDEALLRLPTEVEFVEARELVAFKLRLAKIEGGRRADFLPDLEAQTSVTTPNGYWAMTAAATAFQDGDLHAAANWLTRARQTLDSDRFDSLLGDFFFRAFADRPEVLSFFGAAAASRERKAASRTAFFVDP